MNQNLLDNQNTEKVIFVIFSRIVLCIENIGIFDLRKRRSLGLTVLRFLLILTSVVFLISLIVQYFGFEEFSGERFLVHQGSVFWGMQCELRGWKI